MSKKLLITGGLVATVIAVAGVAAHAERGQGYGHHGYGHQGYGNHGYGEPKRGRYKGDRGERHGWRRRGWREVTRDEYDARTRSRFAKWDANGDGVVDSSEVEAYIAWRLEGRWSRGDRGGERGFERMLRRFDRDGDRQVTSAEVDTWLGERFERIDLNGDGRITDEDLPPMMRGREILSGKAEAHFMGRGHRGHGRRHHRRRGGGMHGMMMRSLLGADTNGDNAITPEEFRAKAMKRFQRFDRDGDGTINLDDLDALRKEIVDYRVRRFIHRFGGGQNGKLTLEQFKEHRDKRFQRRDRNGDGVITRDEGRGGWGRGGRGRGGERGMRRDRQDRAQPERGGSAPSDSDGRDSDQ